MSIARSLAGITLAVIFLAGCALAPVRQAGIDYQRTLDLCLQAADRDVERAECADSYDVSLAAVLAECLDENSPEGYTDEDRQQCRDDYAEFQGIHEPRGPTQAGPFERLFAEIREACLVANPDHPAICNAPHAAPEISTTPLGQFSSDSTPPPPTGTPTTTQHTITTPPGFVPCPGKPNVFIPQGVPINVCNTI